jgi:phenylacetate-CoA ligase
MHMLPEAIEWALQSFEGRVVKPKRVRQVARLLEKLANRRPDAGLVPHIQRLRLRRTMHYAYNHSPFYRDVFEGHRIRPGDIRELTDLQELPFTTSDAIRDPRRCLCVPDDQVSAVFTTSGSTGEPKRVYFTWRDIQMLTNLAAVFLRVGHPSRLWVLIALPIGRGLWIGTPLRHASWNGPAACLFQWEVATRPRRCVGCSASNPTCLCPAPRI